MKSPPKIKTISINVIHQRLLRDHGIIYKEPDSEAGFSLWCKLTSHEIQLVISVDADLTTDEMAAVDSYMVLGHGEILAARFDYCLLSPQQRAVCRRYGVSLYNEVASRRRMRMAANG